MLTKCLKWMQHKTLFLNFMKCFYYLLLNICICLVWKFQWEAVRLGTEDNTIMKQTVKQSEYEFHVKKLSSILLELSCLLFWSAKCVERHNSSTRCENLRKLSYYLTLPSPATLPPEISCKFYIITLCRDKIALITDPSLLLLTCLFKQEAISYSIDKVGFWIYDYREKFERCRCGTNV